ncbi:MAG: JAB domain-containing protein [Sphingobacteriaceae bacterium]|nr:JAB domain-containing protein [Sphingobacteriaceae bacterium]
MYPSESAQLGYQVTNEQYAFPTVKLSYMYNSPIESLQLIRTSRDIYQLMMPVFDDFVEFYEEFHIILLSHSHRVLGHLPIGKGGLTSCVADPRRVLQAAILSNCSQVILIHNHPSGNLMPSEPDRRLTKRMKEALQLVDINLLDHVILTRSSYYSFADQGESSLL